MRECAGRNALDPRGFIVVAPGGMAYFPPVSIDEARRAVERLSRPSETEWAIVPFAFWLREYWPYGSFVKAYNAACIELRRRGSIERTGSSDSPFREGGE
ncbi:hypothetical protein PSP20601_03772 [Pandoraea sputorum]|nr:hypothetical protein PSP20601_03772 [Pandoraea sputorum]